MKIEYKLITSNEAHHFNTLCQKALKEGWNPALGGVTTTMAGFEDELVVEYGQQWMRPIEIKTEVEALKQNIIKIYKHLRESGTNTNDHRQEMYDLFPDLLEMSKQ